MNATKRLSIAAIFALLPLVSAADVVVSHFESLQQLHVSASEKGGSNVGQKSQLSAPISIRFDALGKSFDLRLVTNERVKSGLNMNNAMSGIGVYRGHLAENVNSWARIVVYDGMPRGLIWDGAEMFAIEAPGDTTLPITSPVIYRLADSYIVPGTMSCGTSSLAGNTALVLKGMNAANKTAIARAPGAVSEITLSAIGDNEFTNLKGGDAAAAAAIATRLSNVDGFFSEQVGVQINVQLIETHSDPNDPFSDTTDAGTLLDDLSEYRLQTASHNSRGVTHLYTGRSLATSTVGIAWLGTICEDYFGTGLSEGRGSALIDSLIAAHEIGHNFGAHHDGEPGRSCESVTGSFIMSPFVNGSEEFSACSIAVMQAHAAGAACVVALPTADVSITRQGQDATLLVGANADFVYEISSTGTLGATGVAAEFSLPDMLSLNTVTASSGTCTSGAGMASCDLGDLPGLSSRTITISATASSVGVGILSASVSTTDIDETPGNNQDSLQVTVDAAVDLVVNAPTSAAVFVNDSTTVTAMLDNVSFFDATNVALSTTLESGLRANTASWSLGTCTVAAQQIDCQTTSFAARSSSTFSISATGISSGPKDVIVTISSTEADANPGNNTAQGVVQVVVPNDEKAKGGGAANPLTLLLLVAAVGIRRRRNPKPFSPPISAST